MELIKLSQVESDFFRAKEIAVCKIEDCDESFAWFDAYYYGENHVFVLYTTTKDTNVVFRCVDYERNGTDWLRTERRVIPDIL